MCQLSTEMLIYIHCEDCGLATVTHLDRSCSDFPLKGKKGVKRSYFATFSLSFLWQVVTLYPSV